MKIGTLSGTKGQLGQVYFQRFPSLFIIGSKITNSEPAWFCDGYGTMIHVLHESIESNSDGSAIRADVRKRIILHSIISKNPKSCFWIMCISTFTEICSDDVVPVHLHIANNTSLHSNSSSFNTSSSLRAGVSASV